MNTKTFVSIINQIVAKATKADIVEDLLDPPGRQPDPETVALSHWFESLDEQSRTFVERVIDQAVDTTLFGMFSVLDGVRAIEDEGEKGHLELNYTKDYITTQLNSPDEEYLHDLYNQVKDL